MADAPEPVAALVARLRTAKGAIRPSERAGEFHAAMDRAADIIEAAAVYVAAQVLWERIMSAAAWHTLCEARAALRALVEGR